MENILYNFNTLFPSEINSIKLVEPIIFETSASIKIPESKLFNILICVTEAVNNAIVHGNKYSPEKNVFLAIKAGSDELIIEIRDEGSGFEPEKLTDPRDPENLFKASGRGIFIIRELADFCEITTNSSGTRILMKFNLL